MGKWDINTRWFMDEGQNMFLVDENIKTIRIVPKTKKPAICSADLI